MFEVINYISVTYLDHDFNTSGDIYLSIMVFLDENTLDYVNAIRETFNRLSKVHGQKVMFINDCDEETLMFIKATSLLKAISSNLDSRKLLEISQYLVLVYKYSDKIKSMRKRKLDEQEYYDYQSYIDKVAHYIHKLYEACEKSDLDVERLLSQKDLLARGLEHTDLDVFTKLADLRIDLDIRFLTEMNLLCNKPLYRLIYEAWRLMRENNKEAIVYVLVPSVIIDTLSRFIPRENIIPI